jgi:hypothetical protein
MNIHFEELTVSTPEVAERMSKWENDPALIPLIRPDPNKEALLHREPVTVSKLAERLMHDHVYLICLEGQLVGEMNYQTLQATYTNRNLAPPGSASLSAKSLRAAREWVPTPYNI